MRPRAAPKYRLLVPYQPSPQYLLLSGEWKTIRGLEAASASLTTSCDFAEKVRRCGQAAAAAARSLVRTFKTLREERHEAQAQ
jgi:hypothetical protein